MRPTSRITEYLPVTQEEDESIVRDQIENRRPSDGSVDEGRPLVQALSSKRSTGRPRPKSSSGSVRPRGPRLPAPPGSASRRVSS